MAEQGDVRVKISADSSEATTGLRRVESAVNSFSQKAQGAFAGLKTSLAGVFAIGAIQGVLGSILDQFGRIYDLSQRLNVSSESIQRIGEAAKLSGSDIETVVKALEKSTVNAKGAVEKGGELADAFKSLGIDAKTFVDLPIEEKLVLLSEGYSQGQSDADKLNATLKILGKSGAELAPLLVAGPDALREALEGASVAAEDTVKKIADVGDRLDKMFLFIKSIGASAIGFLIESVEGLTAAASVAASFVGNLGKGLEAAKRAARDTAAGFREVLNEGQEGTDVKAKTRFDTDNEESAKKTADEAKKELSDRQKYTEDLFKLQEENRQKEREAYLQSLSTAEKRAEIEREIATLKERQKNADPLQQANLKGRELDKQKELADVVKKQSEEAKKSAEDREKRERKISEERIKSNLDAAKDRLDKAKDAAGNSIRFDSLRSIGGGLANVNYAGAARMDTEKQMAIQLAKKQVDELEKIRNELQKNIQATTFEDGSFPAA